MISSLQRIRFLLCLAGVVTGMILGRDSRSNAADAPSSLVQALEKAERILVAAPEADVTAGPGQPFLVEIDRPLRGSGSRGTRARINNSGADGTAPRYKASQRYLFLLVKGAGGRGWANLGPEVLELNKTTVRWIVPGAEPVELPLTDVETLIEQTTTGNPGSVPQRETLSGRWLVYFSERASDVAAWLIDVQPDPQGGFRTQMLEGSLASSILRTEHVDGPEFVLEFVANAAEFRFHGRFANGLVRGVMQAGKGSIVPAWFVPTDVETLERFRAPRQTAGLQEYADAVQSESPRVELLRFVRRFKDQPAGLDGYLSLLPFAAAETKTPEEMRAIIEGYVATGAGWGPELALRAEIDSALALTRANTFQELGLEFADRAAEKFDAQTPAVWKIIVRRIRGQLLMGAGREQEGIEHLRNVRKDSAFDPEITWILSQHAQKNNQLEEALDLLSELVALPGLEGGILSVVARNELAQGKKPPPEVVPSRLVERIWKLLKRPEGGLPGYLDEVYEQRVRALGGDRQPPRGPGQGNRIALLELFTGAQCPPCVGIDIATTALEAAYGHTEAIVLRYHQHTPGPDPLANPDTLQRFAYYHGDGTPSLFINGRPIDGIGGGLNNSQDFLAKLRQEVRPCLEEQIDLTLELSAAAKGDSIEIRAKGRGLPEFPAEVRLRLALAEERVAMPARNGIRVHDMVVRGMPGEVAGIAPRNGQLEYETTIDIAKLRTRIQGYLEHVEKESGETFDRKPTDLTRFVLVGWLQNDDTGEVLQAAAVPVTGKLNPPAVPAPQRTTEARTPRKPEGAKKP